MAERRLTEADSAHMTRGISRLLSAPWIYDLFQNMVGAKRARRRFVVEFIRPFEGSRILDIGCGTGAMLESLPLQIDYVGFDVSHEYIDHARNHFGARGEFFCCRAGDSFEHRLSGSFDIAIAAGLLHHLTNAEGKALMSHVYQQLAPHGVLIAWDPVWTEPQSFIAKKLMQRDRGRMIRTQHAYVALARTSFPAVEAHIIRDMLRIPYTHNVMRCLKHEQSRPEQG